jgi:hypothetical protein
MTNIQKKENKELLIYRRRIIRNNLYTEEGK